MAHRQVETTSIHSSTYHTGWIRVSPDSPWEIVAHSTHERSGSEDTEGGILPATYLDLTCQIHMPGQMKPWPKSFRWNKDIHFHQNLRLPPGHTTAEKGMLVLFEGKKNDEKKDARHVIHNRWKLTCFYSFLFLAMASEGLTVALSPQPAFQRGSTFEITFGAVGNTKTTIVRKFHKEVSEVSFPCRVCHEGSWSPFWIAVWKGKVYAGTGKQPGHKCLALLNDKEAAAAAADTGSNVLDKQGTESGEPTAEKEPQNAADSSVYVGIGNAAQQRRPLKVRSLQVTLVPSFVAQTLESTNDSSTMDVLMEQQEEIDDEALKEYQEHCRKAKSRAEKFGIEYREPDMASVVPWSQARKLRANPQKGFITGIDITDPDELAKQESRKARFGESNKKRELNEDEIKESQGTPVAANPAVDGSTSDAGDESTPLLQAWDNEELVRFQRSDPPSSLWAIRREAETENDDTDDEFAMETDKPTLTPEKIHMFSIDWAAFKQIRTDDIMVRIDCRNGNFLKSGCLPMITLSSIFHSRPILQYTDRHMWSGLGI